MAKNMTTSYNVVALLPMKANSERIKGKNFRIFAGKPLFRWILDSLLRVDSIDKIIINTDARDILEKNGLVETDRIKIRDRRKELCGDMVSMNKIIEDDISAIDARTYLMTHTTNPLLSPTSINSGLSTFARGVEQGKDSLFSVNTFQTRFYKANGSAVNHDPNHLLRTQDLEAWFEENSNLYIFSRESFSKTNARIGEKPVLFETPHLESVDIDDATGWRLAEIIALAEMLAKSAHDVKEQKTIQKTSFTVGRRKDL